MSKLNNPQTVKYILKDNCPFASMQVIKNLVELILIELVRDNTPLVERSNLENSSNVNNQIITSAIEYMKENIHEKLTIKDICEHLNVSPTYLSNLFNKHLFVSPGSYYIWMKIVKAKKLLREQKLNITEIALSLGFSSVHYFSRCFKKNCMLSPTQYINSIKSIQDKRVDQ